MVRIATAPDSIIFVAGRGQFGESINVWFFLDAGSRSEPPCKAGEGAEAQHMVVGFTV